MNSKDYNRIEPLHLRLDEILDRELNLKHRDVEIIGNSGTLSLALLLSNSLSKNIKSLPHLVVLPSFVDCNQFAEELSFFSPEKSVHLLPHFDVSPYSGLYPNQRTVAERLSFLFHAQRARNEDVFIASIGSLMQRTLPFSVLSKNSLHLKADMDMPNALPDRLTALGYSAAPLVEDVGQFAIRGGIVDVFSAAHDKPVRFDLFGDTIESIRFFSPADQRSLEPCVDAYIIPFREILFLDENYEQVIDRVRADLVKRDVEKTEYEELMRSLVRKSYFPGQEFLLNSFYTKLDSPLDHFSSALNVWIVDPMAAQRRSDELIAEFKKDAQSTWKSPISPNASDLYDRYEELRFPDESRRFYFSAIEYADSSTNQLSKIEYRSSHVLDLSALLNQPQISVDAWIQQAQEKLRGFKDSGFRIFISSKNQTQAERLKVLIEKMGFEIQLCGHSEYAWQTWLEKQDANHKLIHILPRTISHNAKISEERLLFLRDDDFFGKKSRSRSTKAAEDFSAQAKRLNFGDLKPGDFVVHILHGVGQYEGLRVMDVAGIPSEFIQVAYKDKDKLYLPVYRIGQLQKYAGAAAAVSLDKLGGTSWEKAKVKVKNHLRDLASELLQLYAKRTELHRPPLKIFDTEVASFEGSFPYEETEDQLRAINDLKNDFSRTTPMDRLVCGDVGFGKTEVAMRAAFVAAENRKQVAVLAPTTVLSFQHLETFKKRFSGWPVEIRALNRFVSNTDAKQTLLDVKSGKVDILIGTHRLLSKDVEFKDLGLMIIDEEQKFGVAHKEKIKKLKNSVDTLTLSATPIPRTLNMSLVGIRDLSLINTAPVDRLPTRTFICKFDRETIRKAIESEIARGGQVYFIHNRVQSIYSVADEIREIVPHARIRIGHGQMDEDELERTMLSFFNHEIDVLVCTTIVESGMDVPRANTMFIDDAHTLGLSQLYQLRGRVGRSKERAYCYLIAPKEKALEKDAQERLKVIQENTALGSGIRIAQYDLELRGAGNILGEDQSGHVNAVGYELYMDLLNEAIHTAKGERVDDLELDPEVNLRIQAMIPDAYIADIRLRLSYYKALSEVRGPEDLESIESELRDQFGEPPEPVMNLFGVMLIRAMAKKLGVRDVSAGLKNVSLVFTEKTPLKTETIISLATRENKKYAITPDHRLNIRMNQISWAAVYEELSYLLKLC